MNITRSTTKVLKNNMRGVFFQIRNRRDALKREAVEEVEVQRRALLYIARNTSLPATVRHKAQLGLNSINDGKGRPTAVRNRCLDTGKARGVYSKFGLCRYAFRLRALVDDIPGVHKASW